ncbi:LysR family transcriptional regulator [Pseudomonas abieticivorans]|uniref:LysR family transcriptional regulator n=1 Tax=Pseudomonas abieticivorans TaxID=2931382 RepID=UPI0020C14CF1|nr:LysR family transcriptional regulator [Pseudomonas sp. PIA16]
MQLRNLDDLVVFLKVIDCQSFSAAARAMDLAPPTVSKQIARLEKALGASLFERNTRQLSITDEGRAVAERARTAVALLQEACEVAQQGHAQLQGLIQLTAPVAFGSRYVAQAVAAFRQLHPQVGFELNLTDRFVDLYSSEVDLAIRIGPVHDARLIDRHLAQNQGVLVASPQYLAQHGEPASPQALREHACLLFGYPGLLHDCWELHGGKQSERVNLVSELCSDNGDVLRTWCLAGLGISLRETWDVADDLREGRLVRVLPNWHEPSVPISAVRARRDPVPRRLSEFVEFLAQRWAGEAW